MSDEKDRERVVSYLADCDQPVTDIENILGEMDFFRSGEYHRQGVPSEWTEPPYPEHERGCCTICDALRILGGAGA